MKYSVIFLTFIILMSCQKQGSQTLTIEGQIYSKMDSTPFANTSFIVYEHIIGGTFGIKPYTGTTPFTTDHNGNFTVTIEPHVGSAFLLIDWPGGLSLA